jgi:hypothetical protein
VVFASLRRTGLSLSSLRDALFRSNNGKVAWRSKRVLVFISLALAVTFAAIFIWTFPTPLSGLSEHMPRISTLARYDHKGDAVSGPERATRTTYYYSLKTDAALRQAVRKELLSQGYYEKDVPAAATFRKSTGGLFPVHSYVAVGDDGTVYAGAGRSKWPLH